MMTDKEARERIVNKESLSRNIFLNAGAGSGKTESLVRRVLTLIENGSTMDSIVAITFTKEAARMFYDRIGRELKKAAEGATASGETARAELLEKALASIDQAFFGTIDSFCRKLLMEHPQEAGISSRFIPLEREAEQEAFCMELFTAMQRTQTPVTLWKQYNELRNFGIGTGDFMHMIKTGWGVASFTLDPGPTPTPCVIDDDLYDECEREAKWLIKFLEEHFVGENCRCSQFSKTNTEALEKIKRGLGYDERVAAFRAVTKLNEFVPKLPQSKQLKELMQMAAGNSALKLRLENIGRLANAAAPTLESFAKDKYYKSILFMESFCTYVQEEMEERGLATFDSCLLAAVKMLRIDAKQNGDLTSYIQSRYHHFLVDEYQDTSSLQSELFFRLAAQEMDDDWRKIKLKPGALFIVGDEKQAIYRFRGGDVDNYQAVRELFEADDNCDVLQLSCNFRSSAPMTAWFNEVFCDDRFLGKKFPIIEPSDKQSRFGEQSGTIDGVYKFQVIGTKSGTKSSAKVPGNEEEQILKLIRDLLDKRIFKYDHKTQTTYTQPITYSDIMIITANKPSLKKYIQLLSQNGIPYSVAGNSRLAGNPVLPMMERLLKAALYPGDRFLKYECLLNPPFSLTEREVYQYTTKGEGASAAKAFELLNTVTAKAKFDRPSALFRQMIQWLQSWRWLDVTEGDSMDTLYYGLELIRAEEASGKLRNAEELLIFIDKQLRNGGYEYEMATEERSRGIKLLNLHKSKGLEAPVVILADAKPVSEHDVTLCRDFQSRTVYIGSINKTNEFGKKINEIVGTPQFKAHTDAEAEQLNKEQIRLRYVAATRAENVLLIPEYYKNLGTNGIATAGDREDGRWEDYLKATANGVAEYPFTTVTAAGAQVQSTVAGSAAGPDVKIVSMLEGSFVSAKSYETLNPSKVQLIETGEQIADDTAAEDCEPVKAAMADEGSEDGSSDDAALIRTPEAWRAVPATVLGTAVHRLMQAMVDRRYQMVDADHWNQVTKAILAEEAVEDEVREAAEEILNNVAKAMCDGGYVQTVEDEELAKCPWIPQDLPKDLMEELRGADEVYTELPFSLYLPAQSSMLQELAKSIQIDVDSDGFINGIMDLIYYKDGQWIICDYKTNYHREGLYGHYEGQLLLYREIAKKLLDLPELPQAYLYHIPCKVEK